MLRKTISLLSLSLIFISTILVMPAALQAKEAMVIPAEKYEKVRNTRLYSMTYPETICTFRSYGGAFTNASFQMGGGFIGAVVGSLIDSMINASIEESQKSQAQPLNDIYKQNKLQNDLNTALEKSLQKEIVAAGHYRVKTTNFESKKTPDSLLKEHKAGDGALLIIYPVACFSYGMETLNIGAFIELHFEPKPVKATIIDDTDDTTDNHKFAPDPDRNRIFSQFVFYKAGKLKPDSDPVKYWSTEHRLENAFRESTEIVPKLITMKLKNALLGEPEGTTKEWVLGDGVDAEKIVVKGDILESSADRVIIRVPDGNYLSILKDRKYVYKPHDFGDI
ncbi:MAG: hypothetical protein OEY07_10220 [Gammaproteobacteria bacterium]|nr:hypothetical protein [Gammaproteobacteria bacterium]